jgi:hypothetical protein
MNEAFEAAEFIRIGEPEKLDRLLAEHPEIVNTRFDGERTLAHVAADWPGRWPRVRETIACLARHGADLSAAFAGWHAETALHWAASSDDVDALDALLDHGADIHAPGSIFGNEPAIADAVAFGNWRAARRLCERGSKTNLWQSAGLGLMDRVATYFAGGSPTPQEVTNAFWSACWGGQLETAKYLRERGADIHWVGHDRMTPVDAARRNGAPDVIEWLLSLGARTGAP